MGTLNLSNFGLQGVAPLSRDEMKGVTGGNMPQSAGTCCVHDKEWDNYRCGYGREQAEEVADQLAYEHDERFFWCCDSC